MCGIVCVFGDVPGVIPDKLLTHRGPDAYRREVVGKCTMDFYRLAINDLTEAGMQPFKHKGKIFACNGEIYNFRDFLSGSEKSQSDCEVVPDLIETFGIEKAVNMLRGDFAFAYSDGSYVQVARDPVGVRPMFYTRVEKSIAFASEMKALKFLGTKVHVFPPGSFYDSRVDAFVCYYTTYWNPKVTIRKDPSCLRRTLEDAVRVRMATTDRPIGFLLSGGLDSSLVCAIAQRMSSTPIRTFSIGLPGSPDLAAARTVSQFLGTNHVELNFNIQEATSQANIVSIIKTLETYDTTTIRASIPMFYLCKYIKEHTDCRSIFSGEGSDELLGGYLYFKNAPGVKEFAYETMRRLRLIHQFDGLRADRCAGAHGLDLLVPYLDKEFIECCMKMNQSLKVTEVEKTILREAFTGYLPYEILWRQKDAFSDAVGTEWVESLRQLGKWEHVNTTKRMCRGVNVPLTSEEAYYRDIFWKLYDSRHDYLISEIWRPLWTDVTDPSARLLIEDNHNTTKAT